MQNKKNDGYTEKEKAILDKTERILRENIFDDSSYPWGRYRMISPEKVGFGGVWNWDSAFHAIGMLSIDEELAKEQILGFLQFQLEDGMLPDRIRANGDVGTYSSKPPVMADAAWQVYHKTQDMNFLKQVYPMLVKNTEFWERERCIDGLFHYDADKSDNEKIIQ